MLTGPWWIAVPNYMNLLTASAEKWLNDNQIKYQLLMHLVQ